MTKTKRCTCETDEKPWGVGSITKIDPQCEAHGHAERPDAAFANEEIYWEHEMIEHPDPPEDRDDYLPDDED